MYSRHVGGLTSTNNNRLNRLIALDETFSLTGNAVSYQLAIYVYLLESGSQRPIRLN